MILGRYEQQPSDNQTYNIDYSSWLVVDESIAGVNSVSVTPDGLEINNIAVTNDQQGATFTCTGGDDRTRYKIEVTVTTTAPAPRIKQDELFITVRDL